MYGFREQPDVLESLLATRPLVRTVNFHNTPRVRAAQYDRQLERWSQQFAFVDENDLDQYCRTGRWHKAKAGLIVALYNGYRDNYEVFLPLLERHGLVGWFFVATAFVSAPSAEQPAFISRHTLRTIADEYADGRSALTWSELKEIDRNHIVASHTRNHSRLATEDLKALEGEIVGPQQDFQAHLGHPVRSFASLSGAPYGENREADRWIEAANYQFVFSNLKIQRLRACYTASTIRTSADDPLAMTNVG